MSKSWILAAIALAFGMLFVGHVALAAPNIDPTGSLTVEVTNLEEKTVTTSGTYSNSVDWGACLWWGDEEGDNKPTCFPGDHGSFDNVTHQYGGWGVFTPTLVITGSAGVVTYTQPVTFTEPSVPLQSDGTLTITVTDSNRLQIMAEGNFENASGDWNSCLDWGDSTSMCFPGKSGTFSETHEYETFGTFTITLSVTGTEGISPFQKVEVVKFEEPVQSPEPSGTLTITVTDQSRLQVEATGAFENAMWDWQSCLNWGDEAEVCFPGSGGTFTETHEFESYGTFTVTLAVTGTEGTTPFSTYKVIEFKEPEPTRSQIFLPLTIRPPAEPDLVPVCVIETTKISQYEVSTTLIWTNFPEEWYHLLWGDESKTHAEAPGFKGPSGESTWRHTYDPGQYWQEVKIGAELICENQVAIP